MRRNGSIQLRGFECMIGNEIAVNSSMEYALFLASESNGSGR